MSTDDGWVFLALFRCAHCGGHVEIRHYDGDAHDLRTYRHLRVCARCAAARRSALQR